MKLAYHCLDFVLFCASLQDSGLYEYITFGTLDGVRPDICHQVYCDLDYRKIWDSYVKGKAEAQIGVSGHVFYKAFYYLGDRAIFAHG